MIGAGMAGVPVGGGEVDGDGYSEGAADSTRSSLGASRELGPCRRGEVLVGPALTKSRMSSGVFAGVTLSMNWKEGRRRTVVLWSEWSGMGMLEAESMRRCGCC